MSAAVLFEYQALEEKVLAALRPDLRDADFSLLALEIHAFQCRWNVPYAAWCATKPAPATWQEIPAVPQAMFKQFRLSCFPPELVTKIFRTSGTTGETRGEQHLRDARLYEAAVLAGWGAVAATARNCVFLSPSPTDAPDSSLSHMFGTLATKFAGTDFGAGCFLCGASGQLDPDRLNAYFFDFLRPSETVAIFGTALAFLIFFEWLGSRRIELKKGSYALETGGFKGSGRDIAKAELYAQFDTFLGLRPLQVWNEYGMCELSSQFYTRGLGQPHRGGPWVRAQVISPATGVEVAIGETGILRIIDLANLGSVLAVQTADLAIRREDGFELLGRDPGAIPRGCSRAADETMRKAIPSARPTALPRAARSNNTLPPLGTTRERAAVLARAAAAFPFLGEITADALLEFVRLELGGAEALDRFVPYGRGQVRAVAPQTILHIVSRNTPAAALQSLIRGLLLGSANRCKLPFTGLPEVTQFIGSLPPKWRAAVEFATELPDAWLADADAIVVFGSDETIAHFHARTTSAQIFVPHGHKLSFGIVFDDPESQSAPGAARDASLFDQQGCLSPTVLFVQESSALTTESYAARLAREMEAFATVNSPGPLTLSETNAIQSLREETAFRIANGAPLSLFRSVGTDWTVIADRALGFPSSPLNRVVFVKPLPENLQEVLGVRRNSISTIGIYPSTAENATFAATLGALRVCPIGSMQIPPLTWHHDGSLAIGALVKWIDWEG